MPIYLYRCTTCNVNIEVVHSMDDLNTTQRCLKCSAIMRRLVAPFSFCIPATSRDKVLKALNGEAALPTSPNDRPRLEKALARGLDFPKAVVGRGF